MFRVVGPGGDTTALFLCTLPIVMFWYIGIELHGGLPVQEAHLEQLPACTRVEYIVSNNHQLVQW